MSIYIAAMCMIRHSITIFITIADLRAGPVADSPRDLSPAEHEQDGADRVSVQAEVEDLEQEREGEVPEYPKVVIITLKFHGLCLSLLCL